MVQLLRAILILTCFALSVLVAISIKRALTWFMAEYLSTLPKFVLHIFFNFYTYIPLLITSLFIYFAFDNLEFCCSIWSVLGSIALGVTVFQITFYLCNLVLGANVTFPNEIIAFICQHLVPFAASGISIGILIGLTMQRKVLHYSGMASFLTVLWMIILGSYRMCLISIPEWLKYILVFVTCIAYSILATFVVTYLKPKPLSNIDEKQCHCN